MEATRSIHAREWLLRASRELLKNTLFNEMAMKVLFIVLPSLSVPFRKPSVIAANSPQQSLLKQRFLREKTKCLRKGSSLNQRKSICWIIVSHLIKYSLPMTLTFSSWGSGLSCLNTNLLENRLWLELKSHRRIRQKRLVAKLVSCRKESFSRN